LKHGDALIGCGRRCICYSLLTAPDAKRLAGNDGGPFMGMGGPPGGMGGGMGPRPGLGAGPPGSGGSEQDDITVPDKMVGLSK